MKHHLHNSLAYSLCVAISSVTLIMPISHAADSHQHKSQYAGQQTRTIKSLSKDDIMQLSEGKGWGLAKAAELNGVPGPAHLLEMKKEIGLTKPQIDKIQTLFDEMKREAQKLGKKLIRLESELNQAFADRKINKASLKEKLASIANVRKELRYVHLATHLETPDIVSEEQIQKYNMLRGYTDDPCKNIPKGHDKNMWLKHNDCK